MDSFESSWYCADFLVGDFRFSISLSRKWPPKCPLSAKNAVFCSFHGNGISERKKRPYWTSLYVTADVCQVSSRSEKPFGLQSVYRQTNKQTNKQAGRRLGSPLMRERSALRPLFSESATQISYRSIIHLKRLSALVSELQDYCKLVMTSLIQDGGLWARWDRFQSMQPPRLPMGR